MKEINALQQEQEQPKQRKPKVKSPNTIKKTRTPDFSKRIKRWVKKRERERLKEELKKAKQAEKERLKREREEQRKQEKTDFKEYVKGANEQLKKLAKELGMDERDIKVALGGVKGIKLTSKGKISVSSDRKNTLMKQNINTYLENKEAFIQAYKDSQYGEFQRFSDIQYDVEFVLEYIIDEGTMPTEWLIKIKSDSNWEELKASYHAFDQAILEENIQEARSQLVNIQMQLDEFRHWIVDNNMEDVFQTYFDKSRYHDPNYYFNHK